MPAPITHFTSKAAKSAYWNEYMETLPRERLDALHLKKLQLLLRYAYDNSDFYRQKYDATGSEAGGRKVAGRFQHKVPITDKKDSSTFSKTARPTGTARRCRSKWSCIIARLQAPRRAARDPLFRL